MLAVVAVVASSCGSDEDGDDARNLVRAAASDLDAAPVDAVFSITFDSAGETFTMDGDMTVDAGASLGRMTIRMHGLSDVPEAAELDVVIDGDDTYFRNPELYGTSDWVRVSSGEAGIGEQFATGRDPSALLGYLRGAENVEVVGAQTVAGASTTHYRGDVDLDEAVAAMRPGGTVDPVGSTAASEGFAGYDVVFDAWIDDAGVVHRMHIALTPERGGGGFVARVDVLEIGSELDVRVPSGDEVVDLQDLGAAP